MMELSLGLIETRGLIGAVEAADVAAKSASVVVTSAELSQNGNTTITIVGELSSVQAAVEAAAYAVERVGRLISSKVIPRPDEELWKIVGRQKFVSAYGNVDSGPALRREESREQSPDLQRVEKPKDAAVFVRKRIAPSVPAIKRSRKQPQSTEKKAVNVIAPTSISPSQPKSISFAELEKLAVVKLRHYARTLADLPLKGRQISMANKSQLLEAISSTIKH